MHEKITYKNELILDLFLELTIQHLNFFLNYQDLKKILNIPLGHSLKPGDCFQKLILCTPKALED